ncbi:MAG TPA: methylmalonyl Co-A mutase-associated GTPase MeaB [Parafilimonas sp.]|nr:methylmalonyl Co-A mutase-associated GTPase MeaB [Parafilimonas sp.]
MQVLWNHLVSGLKSGNLKALARAISLVENEYEDYNAFLKLLPFSDKKIIGITGPPGAGKSTIADCLINEFIALRQKVGVLCVDPSSPYTKGALLGDRIRMNNWFNNPDVFIRSLASRGDTGGLHPKIIEISDLMKAAPFDHIIIETVGAGQAETEIAGLADTTVVVLVPEAGDDIQNMKSGLMEIADIFVVNKADRPEADRFAKNLLGMLSLSFSIKQKQAPVIKTVATEKKGIEELMNNITRHQANETNNTGNRTLLLAEKAYWLIKQKRMKDINVQALAERIKQLSGEKTFNLYQFVEDY